MWRTYRVNAEGVDSPAAGGKDCMPIGGSFVRKIGTGLAVVCLAVLAATVMVACGSSDNGGGGGGKKGGSIKIGSVLPDKYDPTQNQTIQAYQAQQLVYVPLNTFKHAEGSAGAEV